MKMHDVLPIHMRLGLRLPNVPQLTSLSVLANVKLYQSQSVGLQTSELAPYSELLIMDVMWGGGGVQSMAGSARLWPVLRQCHQCHGVSLCLSPLTMSWGLQRTDCVMLCIVIVLIIHTQHRQQTWLSRPLGICKYFQNYAGNVC